MKRLTITSISIVLVLFGFVCPSVSGQENPIGGQEWEIRLMPYFWIPSIDADATINGLSGSVDLSFDDIIDHLDFTAMGRAEAWKDKWGLTFDGLYMNLGANGSFQGRRGITSFALDADARMGMADFGLAYRIVEQQFGDNNEQKLTFEPYGGLRYAYLRQKIDLNVTIAGVGSIGTTLGGSEDWVEPFVGGRILWDLNDKMAINFRGDAGGFGIGSASKLTWNLMAGIDYNLSENMSLQAGYRILDIDYSRGSGSNKFAFDAQTKGPIIGLTILF